LSQQWPRTAPDRECKSYRIQRRGINAGKNAFWDLGKNEIPGLIKESAAGAQINGCPFSRQIFFLQDVYGKNANTCGFIAILKFETITKREIPAAFVALQTKLRYPCTSVLGLSPLVCVV